MFSKLQHWIQGNREWQHGQNVIWPQFLAASSNGLTLFQNDAMQQLIEAVGPVQLKHAGAAEIYLTGKLPASEATVFIYADGAQIHKNSKAVFMAEREDYAEPQQLIQKFIVAARDIEQLN